jgi:hypothetical protein
MTKVRSIASLELSRFQGYLDAAQQILIRGQLDVTLEATLFEILNADVSNEDVIGTAFPDGSNNIDYSNEESLDEMTSVINSLLSISTSHWTNSSIPQRIESKLRDGYWRHLEACFDYRSARIVALGPHVPWVNIDIGFTYLLYAPDMTRCLVLVGNTSD